jgi:sensor histidine kinase YesM
MVHVGRVIMDIQTDSPIGLFYIDLNMNMFFNLIDDLDTKYERNIVICGSGGDIVFDRNESNIGSQIDLAYPNIHPGDIGIEPVSKNVGDVYLITLPSAKRDWIYVETVQLSALYRQINSILFSILLAAIVLFAVYILAAFFISRQIINPIEYEAKLKEKDSQFKALQSQINPHFLYNTLESINCLAVTKNESEIAEMIQGLARMFRYTKIDSMHTTLENELQHVRDYIYLQALRYEDKFSIQYDIPDALLKEKVLKIMLQPLVENAIYHGMEKIQWKGVIKVWACKNSEVLQIGVSDNGTGIEPGKFEEINSMLSSPLSELLVFDDKRGSIGIFNIHLRIKLYFGPDYGISIASAVNEGTRITISLPSGEAGGHA